MSVRSVTSACRYFVDAKTNFKVSADTSAESKDAATRLRQADGSRGSEPAPH